MYKHPAFVKNVPVNDRPKYIIDVVHGPGKFYATDHTSFECSFTPELCLAVEYEIYAWVLCPELSEYICKSFYCINVCIFKFFRLKVAAKRMSGDMNTSLGNGITNLVTIMFLYFVKYGKILVAILIEGDDSVFRISCDECLTTEEFASLGLITKIEEFDSVNIAAFCGNVFDFGSMTNLVDPGRILRRIGYFDNKYLGARKSKILGLYRASGFSMYYQYHGCPVVEELAIMILRLTRGHFAIMDSINQFKFAEGERIPTSEEKAFELFPPGQISLGNRLIVSQFGLSVDDQLRIESRLRSMTELAPLHIPEITLRSHPDTLAYFRECAVYAGDRVTNLQPPPPIKFRSIITELQSRLKHINNRSLVTNLLDLPDGAEGPYCSCGDQCHYWYDLLFNMRRSMELKPNPQPPPTLQVACRRACEYVEQTSAVEDRRDPAIGVI